MTYDFNNLVGLMRDSSLSPEEIAQAFSNSLNQAIAIANEPTEWENGVEELTETWNYMVKLYIKQHKDEKIPESIYFNNDDMESLFIATIKTHIVLHMIFNQEDHNKKEKETNSFDETMKDFFKKINL